MKTTEITIEVDPAPKSLTKDLIEKRRCHRSLYVALIGLLLLVGQRAEAASNQGCILDENLCDSEETCVQDGLFGQCYSATSPNSVPPILLEEDLTVQQRALLRLELERLADEGLDWSDDRSQCILAYFKISVSYDLNYDTEFCSVRSPGNILTLVQRIQAYLSEEEENANLAGAALQAVAESQQRSEEPIIIEEVPMTSEDDSAPIQEAVAVDEETGDAVPVLLVNEELVEQLLQDVAVSDPDDVEPIVLLDDNNSTKAETQLTEAAMANKKEETEQKDKRTDDAKEEELTKDEDKQLNEYVTDILNNHKTKIHELSTPQLEKLIGFIGSLQENLEQTELKNDEEAQNQAANVEQEELIPLTSELNAQQLLMKKDPEKFGNEDMGLSNIEHKIVKGDVHRVEGNRVYIKIGKENITEEEMYKLINYLDRNIAEPNNMYFNEFLYEDGQLSFRISRLDAIRRHNDKRVDSASRVAQAVYKRRKDIQTLSGVQIDEAGIGSGEDVVPVESSKRDWLFMPILTVCAFTVTSLIVVLAVHMYRNRRRSFKGNLPEILDHLNGKTSTAYEELCRQRMNSQDVPIGVVGKSSSTSSWPDETLLQSCNMDISTGHVILSFLQEYLDSPQKIADQWESVADYFNSNAETVIGEREENQEKNADQAVLPYDETVVNLTGEHTGNGYINASKIHDSDLRQPAYIATQAPLENTVTDFWHCVWEQGITLIVNLCTSEDEQNYQRYWPDEGSKTYGIFEVHLVSEHIWSTDYMVRSFYLKNTVTNETRTVTQFHFLTWSEDGVPNTKALLEFRRKVNKSYRGRSSPVLVHCVKGTSRTGSYILVDLVINRITKGLCIKELNIAGALEHLRDQRMSMVGSLEQFKLAYSCVAEEVQALLKNLQQQQ